MTSNFGSMSPATHKLPDPCGAHLFAKALKRHGVEVMFGQSLPSALYLVTPEVGIRQIAYRTENAGGAMADGCGDQGSGDQERMRLGRLLRGADIINRIGKDHGTDDF